jgi:hypothetical protein
MGRGEAFVHLSPQAGTEAIHSFGQADHSLRNTADVMPKMLRHDVEMAPGLGGRVSHLLAEGPELPAEGPELPAEGPEVLAKGYQNLIKVSAGLGVHGVTLALRPHPFQACRLGYSIRYVWAMTSISTSAPKGSWAAWTVERAGGWVPAWRL